MWLLRDSQALTPKFLACLSLFSVNVKWSHIIEEKWHISLNLKAIYFISIYWSKVLKCYSRIPMRRIAKKNNFVAIILRCIDKMTGLYCNVMIGHMHHVSSHKITYTRFLTSYNPVITSQTLFTLLLVLFSVYDIFYCIIRVLPAADRQSHLYHSIPAGSAPRPAR